MKKAKTFLKDPQSIIGLIILAVMLVMAIFAPVICPGNPIFSVGVPLQAPGGEFLLGTDYLGRDVWAMLVWGSRVSIIFAFGASLLSLLVGIVLGALSGYIGGWLDDLMCRIFELFYIIPRTFLVILMVAFFGSSISLMVIIVGLTIWPPTWPAGASWASCSGISYPTGWGLSSPTPSSRWPRRCSPRHPCPSWGWAIPTRRPGA